MKTLTKINLGLIFAFSMMLVPQMASARTQTVKFSSHCGFDGITANNLNNAKRKCKRKVRKSLFKQHYKDAGYASCKIKRLRLILTDEIDSPASNQTWYQFYYRVTAKCRK